VLAIDSGNEDALAFLKMAEANGAGAPSSVPAPLVAPADPSTSVVTAQPTSFGGGRYEVRRFLGEGGKKRVFLAYDTRLDRDVAFALIKTTGLDDVGRQRVTREAQAMGRLGSHPNIVTIFEMGEEGGSPFVVNELLAGGDVEGELEKAKGSLPLARALAVAKDVARGLAFAHERGIVHRDLKPGNVWLTGEGTAKIGDFGLAVSLDRSRLTQHGMMVGTVAYMPPEQALGGEVTPQADLYSLGAMLYELVTGKPPFQADDPTAVISQHINIAPVAPSWLSDHCPPELEDLILRCLAKVPADRPTSAAEVLAALETVDPEGKSASHSDSGANPLDRLARGVFVGREKELERLRAAFDDAFAGRGGLVLLVGEPGIGKTRTAQELETYGRMRGAQVLWGGSHEGSGAPPYWPWVQAGRQWGSTNDITSIAQEMAPSQGELVRLYPELRTNNPNFVEPPPIGDPESAQFRLFDAVVMFVRAMQGRTPIVIALDDLHWADKPTLLLLQHVAREIGRMRVLILCTYRDTDLSRTHPLSEALASLNRDPGFQRIVLRGLSKDEVASYITATANVAPKAEVVERIYEETEGNPFFLSEVVNLLTQEGTLFKDSLSDIAVPDGVKEALGRRLGRLSEEANGILQVAAIVGREFAYDTLNLLGEQDEDYLLRLIEEGIEARVIEELPQPGRYRFTHALMQETLLGELSTTRRVRLHGQVGEALEERWGGRATERAPRLAEHFLESSTLTPRHAQRAVHYAKLAAQQAEAQAGWDEAAKWYERALALVTAADERLGEDEAELLLALGVAQRNSGNGRASWRNLMRAIDRFRDSNNPGGQVRATVAAIRLWVAADRARPFIDEAVTIFQDGRLRDPDLEAELIGGALLALRSERRSRTYRSDLLARNEELAQSGSKYARATRSMIATEAEPPIAGGGEASIAPCREAFDLFVQVDAYIEACAAAHRAALWTLVLGDLAAAEAEISKATDFISRNYMYSWREAIQALKLALLVLQADWQHADEIIQSSNPIGWELKLAAARALLIRGRVDEAFSVAPTVTDAYGIPWMTAIVTAARATFLFHAGAMSAAEAAFHEMEQVEPEGLEFSNGRSGTFLCLNLVADCYAQFVTQGGEFYTRARLMAVHLKSAPVRTSLGVGIKPAIAAVFLREDDFDEAERQYRIGLEWAARERCPVELGRCHQGLAVVAERRGDMTSARVHLDAAGELFSKHGAKLYLDQVLKKKEFLKA
jgi:tetratricopeptide (TPR) repeat protein